MATERLSCEKGHVVSFGSGGTIAKAVGELRQKQNKRDIVIPSDLCSQCTEKEILEAYDHQKKSSR